MGFNIAIDGPAGAGKSTIAKKVSGELSYIYVDTGAMYRAMALYVAQQGIDPKDQEALSRECVHADITIAYENGEQVVLLDGKNVNDRIRTEAVSSMASVTSVNPDVRKKLMVLQQKLAREKDVVMDGRDIGTCVLPDANLKIYLTASVETRARRRFLEYEEKEFRPYWKRSRKRSASGMTGICTGIPRPWCRRRTPCSSIPPI